MAIECLFLYEPEERGKKGWLVLLLIADQLLWFLALYKAKGDGKGRITQNRFQVWPASSDWQNFTLHGFGDLAGEEERRRRNGMRSGMGARKIASGRIARLHFIFRIPLFRSDMPPTIFRHKYFFCKCCQRDRMGGNNKQGKLVKKCC